MLESLDVGLVCLFSLIQYMLRGYGSSSYIKIIGSRARSQELIKLENTYNCHAITSIGNNSGSTKLAAVKYEYMRAA